MQKVGKKFLRHLRRPSRKFIDVVEFYDSKEINITDADAPSRALGRFSQFCATWNGFEYKPYLKGGIGDITYTMTRETNHGTLKFSNINREMTAWALLNTVQGMRVVVRRIDRKNPDDFQIVAANLRARRPKGFMFTEFTVELYEDDGGLNRQIPRRHLQKLCPLDFGGMMCLNCQPLSHKSLKYQSDWLNSGEDGCEKTFEDCAAKNNTDAFQGLRFQAVSGSFQYSEQITKRVFFFFKRKKTIWKTFNYSSQNIEEDNDIVGMVFGRAQIVAKPLQWIDTGTIIKSTQWLSEGKISSVAELRCRSKGFTASNAATLHLGECGGTGTQLPDPRFPNSGALSRLAYFGEDTSGSDQFGLDNAPIYTAIVRGIEFDTPDGNGLWAKKWTDIGAFMTRGLYLDAEFGGKSADYWDDASTVKAANICRQIIEDRTNTERAVINQGEQPNYAAQNFRRFRSTGVVTGYRFRDEFGQNAPDSVPEDLRDAYIDWVDPLYPPSDLQPIIYLRRRYTTNVWLREEVALKDFINKTILPSFNGYLVVNRSGKTEVRVEAAVDHAYTRQRVAPGETLLPVDDIRDWINDRDGFVIVGNGRSTAEPHRITNYRFTSAGNGITLDARATGGIEVVATSGISFVSSATFEGGNDSQPARATITLSGTPSAFAQIFATIDGIKTYYTLEADDTIESAAAMLAAHINAQPTIKRYVLAEANGAVITLICTSGYLELETPLIHAHDAGEENIRVAHVFEDCGNLKLDNIKRGSFQWNDEEFNETTRIKTTFINAVDDFAITTLERKARAAERILGTQNTYELDGTGVDNWDQILRLTKSKLIEFRDCDFWANWESWGEATLLEPGDVVAVRHTSGDSKAGLAVNYMPLRIRTTTQTAQQTIKLKAQLYLTAQYSDEVRQAEPTSVSTLTPDPNAGQNSPPPPEGTSGTATGGAGGSDATNAPYNPYNNYGHGFVIGAGFSPTGKDVGGV